MLNNNSVKVVKQLAKKIIARVIFSLGLFYFFHKGKTVILMYHRVLPNRELVKPHFQSALIVSDKDFEQNIICLKKYYEIISLPQYLELRARNTWSPNKRYAIITLDDGWEDNYQFAAPLVTRQNVSASIFLATGFIDSEKTFWWQAIGDSLLTAVKNTHQLVALAKLFKDYNINYETPHHLLNKREAEIIDYINGLIVELKNLPPQKLTLFSQDCLEVVALKIFPKAMTWQQVIELDNQGFCFGPHSVNHSILTTLDDEQARCEIIESQKQLASHHLKNTLNIFCYPNGTYDSKIKQWVKEIGFEAALSTKNGRTSFTDDLYSLPRINISQATSRSALLFKFKLLYIKRGNAQ
jgi:peptidoglycan/xylan/chitin deacetylase (PgdA/CDA1 family)